MSDEIINWQSLNALLRGKFERIVERSDKSVRDMVESIASKQPHPVDDPVETLKNVHDNLQRRKAALIDAGVAKKEDFEGV